MATAGLNDPGIIAGPMDIAAGTAVASSLVAVSACVAIALGYVLILYAPTYVLRLPPPTSLESFLIRRFACAMAFSVVSVLASAALLGIGIWDLFSMLSVYGIRADHMWQCLIIPLLLTSLLYAGSLLSKLLFLYYTWNEHGANNSREHGLCNFFAFAARRSLERGLACLRSVLAWRNYVVAPLTEELVFRACMIPLLLCCRFQVYNIIFLSPVFFSLAHMHHFLELYYQQRYSFMKALITMGLQLGYTVVFGWYASFLFLRTGNLIPPVVAHILCNIMGLPVVLSSRTKGLATIAFVVGLACFLWLLFPASSPNLYNSSMDGCSCWHGYCSWH
ncbi:CAAX prenyl protease 2 [Apostasia shenzhenica]|uniref:intramembrane prenyl-peptidase Rce1 n=1 Tax=Apostasia shenzhenica TaxID=1088818 RepID=A0A2H9ZW61_9ASPA|nr:CAAX prenyl protease 2 [Apostasia shenzhenica]